jgi:quercetin dioxygenase-like cupin family protein
MKGGFVRNCAPGVCSNKNSAVEEVAIKPGGRVLPHRHTGPVFGYVLEGEFEQTLNDEPVTTDKAGDTFYEPSGCVHRVTRNPSVRENAPPRGDRPPPRC